MSFGKIHGTGTGTTHPAATDVAKESGTTVFGGVELISDPNNPQYIGHGVAHRDPKTGSPISASVHIPTHGELHPESYNISTTADQTVATSSDLLESKYGISRPGKYHASWYKAKSVANATVGKVTGSQKHLEKAVRQSDIARLEQSAFEELNGGYTFTKE
ncbi:hypothetical protein IW140_000237 [Coemansia sp. RSA 1813]|nr:hypothetical protein EV178_000440 [Coemansia sp. RSA 1646]KAJ1773789.1 hypothetical protein LPJ74_000333 [Coemansia sp. RSA 1843]KAJ2093752.1 hypothetical protein IW138_000148 [Coemansia sp. RSA 986]KAJ2217963.1 hypothetical protein EV179_000108 [Coemansia sp. RSA 487]KAJ2573194.1 hypothetical protein IW140_000237 [Coemansia sp. RSA 1813]